MNMKNVENYVAPQTLAQAAAILATGEATILAGGTDLMPQTHSGKRQFKPTLINIRRIDELRGVSKEAGVIRIGALTTISDLLADTIVRDHLPALAQAADHFASNQIRNVATIGGSLCNASPAGDAAPPLLVYDAEVELVSQRNGAVQIRSLKLADFFVGPGRTAMRPDELLAAICVPVPIAGHLALFMKFGTRPALDISTISIAIGGIKAGQVLRQVRLALGAVAPVPCRAVRTEALLEGAQLDAALIDRVAMSAREEIKPISDIRASAWYRQELVHNIVKRMLQNVSQS